MLTRIHQPVSKVERFRLTVIITAPQEPEAEGGNQLALTAVQSTSCWTASFRTAGCMADIQLKFEQLANKNA
jgi:hypothetical protein